jgi:hypothetical protein
MNELFVTGTVVRDSNIVHESAKERYRNPLGAVSVGTCIDLNLSINNLNFEKAHLVMLSPSGRMRRYV